MLCYLICFDSQFCQLTNKLLFLTYSLKIRFFFLVFSQIVPIWYWSTLLLFLKYRAGRQLLIFYFLYFYTNRPHCRPISYWPYFQLLFPHKLFFFPENCFLPFHLILIIETEMLTFIKREIVALGDDYFFLFPG